MRTSADPDRLAERMIPVAAQLAGTVHDDGPEQVAAIIDPLTRDQINALCVVLAAMVPVDRTVSDLLAWIDDGCIAPTLILEPRRRRDRRMRRTNVPVDKLPYVDDEELWTRDMLLTAHAAHGRGVQDPRIALGERIYNRQRKQDARGAAA